MSQVSSAPGQARAEDAARVSGDLLCLHCGYNLKTLSVEARCPECGTAVGRSLMADRLRFCDPGWLRQVSRGLNIIVAMAGVALLVWGLTWCAATAWNPAMVAAVAGFAWYAAGIGAAIGAWLFATPERREPDRGAGGLARRLVRVLACIAVSGLVLHFMAASLPHVRMVAGAAAVLAMLGGAVAIVLNVRRLALRIPDPGLADDARTLLWGVCIAVGLTLVGLAGRAADATALRTPAAVAITLGGCMFPLLALFWILFLTRVRQTLAEVASYAQLTWPAATPSDKTPDTPPSHGEVDAKERRREDGGGGRLEDHGLETPEHR